MTAIEAAAGLFAERELAVEAHYRVQRFFLRLDRRTDFRLADAPWRSVMARLGVELTQRLKLRAFHAERGRGVAFAAPKPAVLAAAREVSAVCVGCAEELAGHPWRLISFAFELFVTGRVAVAHRDRGLQQELCTHGAPNGWSYFLFAELAILCLEGGIDAPFWDEALPAMVCTSELLCRHPAEPPAEGITSEERGKLYGYRDGRARPMADVLLAREVYDRALLPLAAPDRRRRLCDCLGLIAASARFHNLASVWWTPGTIHPLTDGAPIAKALLDARSARD